MRVISIIVEQEVIRKILECPSPHAPPNLYEGFAYTGTVRQPTTDDLTLMVLLEAAGNVMYDDLAADAGEPDVRQRLLESGQDEYLHAQRLAQVLTLLNNEPHSVPDPEGNPYLVGWEEPKLSAALVENLAGDKSCPYPYAAKLLRQNGGEETAHAERLRQISQRLSG